MILLLEAILLGLGAGAFSLFLESCMQERMIFRRYRVWLERLAVRNKHFSYWLKPLGLCVYCFSEWVFIGLMVIWWAGGTGRYLGGDVGSNPTQIALILCIGSGFSYLIVDLWMRTK